MLQKMFFILVLLGLYILGFLVSEEHISADLSLIQISLFPLIALLLVRLKIGTAKLPVFVLLLGTAFMLASFLLPRSHGLANNAILIASLEGDMYDADSRIFRSSIKQQFLPGAERDIADDFDNIGSADEADEFLNNHKNTAVLVWGSKRWLTVIVRNEEPFQLGNSSSSDVFKQFFGLNLIQSPGMFGLSFEPSGNTARFLALFFGGYVPTLDAYGKLSPEEAEFRNSSLAQAGRMEARWTFFAHRAVPWFYLGNRYLIAAFKAPSYDKDAMEKAQAAYQQALSFLKPQDNYELLAALYNNLGISAFIRSRFEDDRAQRSWGIKLLTSVAHRSINNRFIPFLEKSVSIAAANRKFIYLNFLAKNKKEDRSEIGGNDDEHP